MSPVFALLRWFRILWDVNYNKRFLFTEYWRTGCDGRLHQIYIRSVFRYGRCRTHWTATRLSHSQKTDVLAENIKDCQQWIHWLIIYIFTHYHNFWNGVRSVLLNFCLENVCCIRFYKSKGIMKTKSNRTLHTIYHFCSVLKNCIPKIYWNLYS